MANAANEPYPSHVRNATTKGEDRAEEIVAANHWIVGQVKMDFIRHFPTFWVALWRHKFETAHANGVRAKGNSEAELHHMLTNVCHAVWQGPPPRDLYIPGTPGVTGARGKERGAYIYPTPTSTRLFTNGELLSEMNQDEVRIAMQGTTGGVGAIQSGTLETRKASEPSAAAARQARRKFEEWASEYAQKENWGTSTEREKLISEWVKRAMVKWHEQKAAGEERFDWHPTLKKRLMGIIMREIESERQGPADGGIGSSTDAQGELPLGVYSDWAVASQADPPTVPLLGTSSKAKRQRKPQPSRGYDPIAVKKSKEKKLANEVALHPAHKWDSEGQLKIFVNNWTTIKTKFFEDKSKAAEGDQRKIRQTKDDEDVQLEAIIKACGAHNLPDDFRPGYNGSGFVPGSRAEKAYLEGRRSKAPVQPSQAQGGVGSASSRRHEHQAQPSALQDEQAMELSPRHGARAQQPHIQDDRTQARWTPPKNDPLYYDRPEVIEDAIGDNESMFGGSPSHESRQAVVSATGGSSPNIIGQSPVSHGAGSRSRASSNAGSPVAPVTRRQTHELSKSPPAVAGSIRSQKSNSPSMFGLDLWQPKYISDEDFYKQHPEIDRMSLDDPVYTGKGKAPMVPQNLAAGQTRSRSSSGSNQSPIEIPAIGGGLPSRWDKNPFSSQSTQQPSGSMPRPQAKKSKHVTHAAGSPGQGFVGSPPSTPFGSPPPSSSAPRREVSRQISNLSLRQSASPAASTPAATTPPPIRQGTPRVQHVRPTTPLGPTSTPRNTTPHRNPAPPTVAPATGAGRGQGTGGAPHGSRNQGPANKNAKKTSKKTGK